MSSPFDPYYNNHLTYDSITNSLADRVNYTCHLDATFFEDLTFDEHTLKQYRINAATRASNVLGDRIALAFSGGIDSQAMIQCFIEAGIKFDVFILTFTDDMNSQDVDHARLFAEKHNFKLNEIELDIISFLTRDSYEMGIEYKCTSPQFASHYVMYDKIREMGYTGICCGGTAFAKSLEGWGPTLSAAQSNYVEYSKKHSFPVLGNFLGYDPYLCWAIALQTPSFDSSWKIGLEPNNDYLGQQHLRYLAKVEGYRNTGFDIIPQETKFNGFEKVKEYFAKLYKDGWAFEKKFRYPLEKKYGKSIGFLNLTTEQNEVLEKLYIQRHGSNSFSASGVPVQ